MDDSIIALLEEMRIELAALTAMVQLLSPATTAPVVAVADDADLDSQYGNPEVRSDPKRWQGESMKGRLFSECSSEYLGMLAGLLDWQAQKDEEKNNVSSSGKPTAPYKRRDAARARGWAKRNEGKTVVTKPAPVVKPEPVVQPVMDEIPF